MSRPQRPCRQPHGTMARYVAGCSCFDCCNAWRDYLREKKTADQPSMVDATPIRDRIKVLEYNGWRWRGISEQAAVSYASVRDCRTGKRARVHREFAEAVMSLPLQTPIPTDSTALVPARSTLRLLERLRRQYGLRATAEACGVHWTSLPHRGQHSVQARTAKRIREAADRLDAQRGAVA